MEKTAFDARYQEYLAAIEDYLNGLFAEKPHWADLYEAMRYSVLSGGKRLRPVMTLEAEQQVVKLMKGPDGAPVELPFESTED